MGNTMNKPHVIVHPSNMTQSDWVRCILPFMQFMCPNPYQVAPSITHILTSNKDALKKARSVILQKPSAAGRMEAASMYAGLKRECNFKLITDFDDLMWDLSPVIQSYAQGIPNHDQIIKDRLKQVLPLFDTIVCSTRYLANRVKADLGVHAIVMPNGVSKSLFGPHKTTSAFTGKPKVMYAGALGHTTEKIPGDFEGPWIPWIKKSIEDGSIDFFTFGNPEFLKGLEGKYTSIPYTSVMEFPGTAASYRPDFYLAPLASNNFNRAKSDLKLKEAAALGAVFIGSDFEDSPYGYAPKEQLITESDTPESLADKFNALCKPENFMNAIEWQYNMIEKEHWYIEDPVFQRNFAFTYFG